MEGIKFTYDFFWDGFASDCFFSRFSGILNAKTLFIHFLFFVYVCMLPITGQSVTIRKYNKHKKLHDSD